MISTITEAARLNGKEVHSKLVEAIAIRVLRSDNEVPRHEIRMALEKEDLGFITSPVRQINSFIRRVLKELESIENGVISNDQFFSAFENAFENVAVDKMEEMYDKIVNVIDPKGRNSFNRLQIYEGVMSLIGDVEMLI
mgnify:CR=1 FL=1